MKLAAASSALISPYLTPSTIDFPSAYISPLPLGSGSSIGVAISETEFI